MLPNDVTCIALSETLSLTPLNESSLISRIIIIVESMHPAQINEPPAELGVAFWCLFDHSGGNFYCANEISN